MSANVSPRARAWVKWTIANGRTLWLVALLLAIPATWRTVLLYAHLKSDVEALLPQEAPSVLAVKELRARMAGLQYLGVIVDAGTAENVPAAEHFLDDLAGRIRAYPPELQRRVRLGDQEERKFLEDHAPLYLDVVDLVEIRQRIERRRDYEVTKATNMAVDDDEPPPPLDFSDIEKKYTDREGGGTPRASDDGRFSDRDKHLSMLLVEVGEFATGGSRTSELFRRVKADVASLGGPEKYAAGMRVGYTGDVAISVEETEALMSDLSVSSLVVVALVMGVLVFYYRWWRSIFVLIPPLLVATVYAFGVASLPPFAVRELNSNTAFLGSIIVGNGINFGILLLARYVEERRRGVDREEAMVVAWSGSRAGTLSAALAAATSYAALAITDFQGFRQFGTIGGIGMIFAWGVAYVLVPPLALFVDRDERSAPRPVATRLAPASLVGRFVERFPVPIVLASGALTLFAVTRLRGVGANSLEYDFSKLRRADTFVSGEGYWGRQMDALLGTYLTPMVVLADDEGGAKVLAERLRAAAKQAPLDGMLASIRTVDEILPDDQPRKIAEARAIKKVLTPKIRAQIPDDKRALVARFDKPDWQPITVADLPATFTAGSRERDGSIGKAVLVYPKPSSALWEGPSIEVFVRALRAAVANDGRDRAGRVAGSLPVSADILASIRHDGPIASIAAFLGVVLTVVAVFRTRATGMLVLLSLVLGVTWLAASTLVFGVKINFANFIAFPITFGIGVDYAVNVMTRVEEGGREHVGDAIATTGGAVALASATTVIGYSSLLLAENRALYLFGWVAVLGEICCVSAALLTLPALVVLLRRARR